MLICAMCGKPLKECCDIFETAYDAYTGEEVVLCGDCTAKLEGETEGETSCEEHS